MPCWARTSSTAGSGWWPGSAISPTSTSRSSSLWTVAVVSLPFGRVSETTAAIPPVLASLVGVIGVIMIGRLLWGWWTGVVAGLVLVTTPFHFEMSHQVLPDLMLNAWLVWALYWLLRAQRSGWPLGHVLAFYACLTGGLLSKGPQALAALAAAGVAIAATDGAAGVRRDASPPGRGADARRGGGGVARPVLGRVGRTLR